MTLKLTHPELSDSLGILETFSKEVSFWSGDIMRLMRPYVENHASSDIETTVRCTWAGIQWFRSGKPIFRLEPDLLNALINTKPPSGILEILPEIPFPGIYIALDGEHDFYLEDSVSGFHKAEGIYICRDLIRTGSEASTVSYGLLVLAIGENKSSSKDFLQRNDTIQYFGMIPGMKLGWEGDTLTGMNETLALVVNLLFLMSSEKDSISETEVVPPKPKSPKKLKRAARKKISFEKYIRLGLSKTARQKVSNTKNEAKKGGAGPTHVTVVAGHWHKYWVLDPGNRQVFDQSTRGEKQVYLIRKWIHPYPAIRRGPDPKRNIYKVVK